MAYILKDGDDDNEDLRDLHLLRSSEFWRHVVMWYDMKYHDLIGHGLENTPSCIYLYKSK
jgi:hypothetical protein